MKALITGASSGMGRDMARELAARGCELWLVARRKERMEELAAELPVPCHILCCDLSEQENCRALYDQVRGENIDILINNAGKGLFGAFVDTDLDAELEMLDVNLRAVHILAKLFLRDFVARDAGYILNVASIAGFMPGPLLASYYSSKAYVVRLTQSLREELRRAGSKVYVGALCPGPVRTEFDEVAGVSFSLAGMESSAVAAYALRKMFARKGIILPGILIKLACWGRHLCPDALLARMAYRAQHRKYGEK